MTKQELLIEIAQARLDAANVRVKRAQRRLELVKVKSHHHSADEDTVIAECDVALTQAQVRETTAQLALAQLVGN